MLMQCLIEQCILRCTGRPAKEKGLRESTYTSDISTAEEEKKGQNHLIN
jgi:hypothetical protein